MTCSTCRATFGLERPDSAWSWPFFSPPRERRGERAPRTRPSPSRRSQNRRQQDSCADLEVHLRPVHRAHRRHHQHRSVGRNAGRPEVLPARGGAAVACAAGSRPLRRVAALVADRSGRFDHHGRGPAVRRRALATRDAQRRGAAWHPPGGPRRARGQGVLRAHRPRGYTRRPGRCQPGLGRGRGGTPGVVRGHAQRDVPDVPAPLHGALRQRRREDSRSREQGRAPSTSERSR